MNSTALEPTKALERLVAILGQMTEGGPVSDAAVLLPLAGARSTPYLLLRVHPWPLPPEALAALRDAGYRAATPDDEARVYQGPAGERLEFTTFDDDDVWPERLSLRDLLAVELTTGARVEVTPDDFQNKERVAKAIGRQRSEVGFTPVQQVAALLEGLDVPWCIASGWALDVHLGVVTRLHDDLDVAVPYDSQLPVLERLRAQGFRLDVPVEPGSGVGGGVYRPWEGELVTPPRTQVHARRIHDPLGGELLDILLTPGDTESWHFRREPEIRLAWNRARLERVVDEWRIPYLAPEIVCLFKVGGAGGRERDKDQRDLERVLSAVSTDGRAWLYDSVRRCYPDSPWLEQLTDEARIT